MEFGDDLEQKGLYLSKPENDVDKGYINVTIIFLINTLGKKKQG